MKNKGVSLSVNAVVLIVLGMLCVVALWWILSKAPKIAGSLSQLPFINEQSMEDFKKKASPLEQAIACSYLICKQGCGYVKNWGDLSWKDEKGQEVTCREFCERLPTGRMMDESFCGINSANYPIVVNVSGDKINIDDFKLLIKNLEDVCIYTDKIELQYITGEWKGKCLWIVTKKSNIEALEYTECGALKTKKDNRNKEKMGIASGVVKDGVYYIFTYEDKPPWISIFHPTVGVDEGTVCISPNKIGGVTINQDPRDLCKSLIEGTYKGPPEYPRIPILG